MRGCSACVRAMHVACNAWLQCEHEKHMHEVHALNACVKCMRENEKKRLLGLLKEKVKKTSSHIS